jgi:hypothetical protein
MRRPVDLPRQSISPSDSWRLDAAATRCEFCAVTVRTPRRVARSIVSSREMPRQG